MKKLAARDAFGLHRVVYAPGFGHAPSVRALLGRFPGVSRAVDVDALRAHLDGAGDPYRTFLEAVRQLPPGAALGDDDGTLSVAAVSGGGRVPVARAGAGGDVALGGLLRAAVARALHAGDKTALALSGGLDSAVLLALVREAAGRAVPAYVLAPRMPGYGETDEAVRTAERFGAAVVLVDVGAEDFRAALPAAVRAMECPLYNAHPVAKLLLARRLREDGFERVITGDGADHVVRRDVSADYLPLVQAAFDDAGVALSCPFLDDDAVAHALARPPDPDKRELRALGARLGVPEPLVTGPKRSRLSPPVGVAALVAPDASARLAARLGRPAPRPEDTDRAWMLWGTTALLLDAFAAA